MILAFQVGVNWRTVVKTGDSGKGLRARLLQQAVVNRLRDADPAVARDYYQSVIDSVASVICTVDRSLRITGVNRRWDDFARANYGEQLGSEQIVGTPFLDLLDAAMLQRWQDVCPKILSGELRLYLDEVSRPGDEAWSSYTLAASSLKDSQGEVLGIAFVIADITKLKKAEAEMLRRLVEIRGFRQVAHIAGSWFDRRAFHKQVTADIAHLFGAEKCIIFRWGARSGHLEAQVPAFGLHVRELSDLSLDIGDPADPASLWQDLEERDYILLNEGDQAPDGVAETSARVDRLAAMMAVLRVSGRVHGAILIAGRDHPFSEQEGLLAAAFAVPIVLAIEDAELNQRLIDRVRQLEGTREEMERMVHAAESMRKPLTMLRGYLELLQEGILGPVAEDQSEILSLLLDRTRGIGSSLNTLLPSRYLPDVNHYEVIDLLDLVRRCYDKWIGPARLAGVDLIADIPSTQQNDFVTTGDPLALFQVFDVLLDRALKASPDGGTIHLSVQVSDDIVYVELMNQGASIPAADLLQVRQAVSDPATVDGSGLADVKRIVEEHGGHVWADSSPSKASVFYVVLPKAADRPSAPVPGHAAGVP